MKISRHLNLRRLRWKSLPLVLLSFRVLGRSYNDFYKWLLDYLERRTTLDKILSRPEVPGKYIGLYDWGRGKYHVQFMLSHGVTAAHRVLDLGCGYGRTAIPLIRILGPDNYVGVDLSDRRIELATEWVKRENLENKNPIFICGTDNSLPFAEDNSFDIVWSMAVFNHMPDKELHELFNSVIRVLKPQGIFFVQYTFAPKRGGHEGFNTTAKDFMRSDDEMFEAAQQHGFKVEVLDDWDSDLGDKAFGNDRMLRLVKAASD